MSSGCILHINEVGLMAALEENLEPHLRGRPFVVAHADAPRSVVLDLSPKAHSEGVRRGMGLSLARNICPGLELRAPRPELCTYAEEKLWRISLDYTPLVEKAGRGHLFVDLSGTSRLFGPPEDAAQKIRWRILNELELSPSMALSGSKTVSKVATRVFRPSGFVALAPQEETELLGIQPVSLLPGVGRILMGRFALLDIGFIGDLALLSDCEARAVGPRGPELVARARGIDNSPVDPELPERRTVAGETVFEPDTADPALLNARLGALCAELGFSLRSKGWGARRVSADVLYTDGLRDSAGSRSLRLLSRDDELLQLASGALAAARKRRVRIRRIGIKYYDIESAGPELDLFEPAETKIIRLQSALDKIHGRFGLGAIAPCARSLYPAGEGAQAEAAARPAARSGARSSPCRSGGSTSASSEPSALDEASAACVFNLSDAYHNGMMPASRPARLGARAGGMLRP